MTVVVTNDIAHTPSDMVDPKILVQPMDAKGQPLTVQRLSADEDYRWQPEKAPFGPMAVLFSSKDRRVIVLRNGVEIGRAKFSMVGEQPFGNQAYIVKEGFGTSPSPFVADRPSRNWMNVSLPYVASGPGANTTVTSKSASEHDREAISRIALPPEFAKMVYEELKPGSSLLLTDQSVTTDNSGKNMTVLTDSVETGN
jgi:hypothetical protein